MALAHCLFESIVQLIRRNFPLVEIGRHQSLIHFNGLIHNLRMGRFCRRKHRVSLSLEETVDHAGTITRRQIYGKTLRAEGFLHLGIDCFQINLILIDMVNHHHPALILILGPTHHSPAGALNALLGVDDDGYCLHCG